MTEVNPKPQIFSWYKLLNLSPTDVLDFDRTQALESRLVKTFQLEVNEDFKLDTQGVSAFRAQYSSSGELDRFIKGVKSNLIPQGSVLIVDSLNRFNDSNTHSAVDLLTKLLEWGVIVVNVQNEDMFTKKSLENLQEIVTSFQQSSPVVSP
ncbi:hypothetical protein AB4098_21835 [Vibrio cyclitrophicus]|nr:hypothetical protein [Vibrio cyclitrophicus]PMJ19541.1 hypothetical protein BCU28_15185 [Vibrio cyclitrophicus]